MTHSPSASLLAMIYQMIEAGDRFFCRVKVGLIQKNHGLMEKVVEGFAKLGRI